MTVNPGNVEQDIVVARVGGEEYLVPRAFVGRTTWGYDDESEDHQIISATADIRVDDNGKPWADSVTLRVEFGRGPLDALELQRTRWARVLEGCVESKALSLEGERRPAEVNRARTRERRRKAKKAERIAAGEERRRVDLDRLREVVALHQEAQANGERWDTYAAARLGYGAPYLRQLYGQAKKAGLT